MYVYTPHQQFVGEFHLFETVHLAIPFVRRYIGDPCRNMRVSGVDGSPLESIAFFNFIDGYFWAAVIVVACGAPVSMSGPVYVVMLGVGFWCDVCGKVFI